MSINIVIYVMFLTDKVRYTNQVPIHKPEIIHTIMGDLFPTSELSKAQQTRLRIIQAAIKSYAESSFEETTPEKIANMCDISRPLVLHYFKNRDVIFEYVMKFIRGNLQSLAVQAIHRESDIAKVMVAYINVSFDWIENFPEHAKVWQLFFYNCSTTKKYHKLNSELVGQGHKRIVALIKQGVQTKVFVCKNPLLAAKMIQLAITGYFVVRLTEKSELDHEEIRGETLRACLRYAGAKIPIIGRLI